MKNNKVWTHILNYIGIIEKLESSGTIQSFRVSTNDIKNAKSTWTNEFKSQFEPRLLCKHDDKQSRPDIFKKHNFNILSIKNGEYLITKENIYVDLQPIIGPAQRIENEFNSTVLNGAMNKIKGESFLLSKLQYSGFLGKIVGEEIMYGPILNGRHRCTFNTILGNDDIEIKGSQCEIDGCYETENTIIIAEVKSKHVDNFNIRQLYYPFRSVYDFVGGAKDFYCLFIFLDKHNNVNIYKYIWDEPEKMMGYKCIDTYKISF